MTRANATRFLVLALCLNGGGGACALETSGASRLFPGDGPVVICAPHGGRLKPSEVADRRQGVLGEDANTADLGLRLQQAIAARSGLKPALLTCLWHRSKVDMNREEQEAAQGDPLAIAAWRHYHQLADQSVRAAVARHGRILLIDLHGQSHPQNRVELGYLHDAADYAQASRLKITDGSAAPLASLHQDLDYPAFLRGPQSLGALLERAGFPATPSPREPIPSEPYFRGGYTLRRLTLGNPGVVGVQIEANRNRLRDSAEGRQRFAEALAEAMLDYLPRWLLLKPGS